MTQSKYCSSCLRKHPSQLWYGVGEFKYCTASYLRMLRQGFRVCHPSWQMYEDGIQKTDGTGARIYAAAVRKDVLAIREGGVLMSCSMMKSRTRLLVSLLASTYYYPWPMHAFIIRIVALGSEIPSKSALARIGEEVFYQFKAFRMLDGELAEMRQYKIQRDSCESVGSYFHAGANGGI